MNEKKRIIFEKIIYLLFWVICALVIIFWFYFSFKNSFPETEYNVISVGLTIIIVIIACICNLFINKRFYAKKEKADIFHYECDDYDLLIKSIQNNCLNNEYSFENSLVTDNNEHFLLYCSDQNRYPNKKFGIYINKQYICEVYVPHNKSNPPVKPGEGEKHFEYKPFFKKICGKWGRNYYTPRDWVDIETTIVVVVEEWNAMLNWVICYGGHLPFVLMCAIVKSDPGKLYIAQDNRKQKRDDYYVRREELFDMLGVECRKPIGETKWSSRCITPYLDDKYLQNRDY